MGRGLTVGRAGCAVVALLALGACTPAGAEPEQVQGAPSATSETRDEGSIEMRSDASDGLPDELRGAQPLWETRREATRNRAESVTRLFEDGRLYTWSDTQRRMVDGQLQRESVPFSWRLDAQIRAEGVDRVRELIRTAFVQLDENGAIK